MPISGRNRPRRSRRLAAALLQLMGASAGSAVVMNIMSAWRQIERLHARAMQT